MDSYLGSLVQSCCREAGTLQTSLACVGRFTVSGLHWLCPHSLCVCFPGLHCSASRLLCWELSKADPGLHALPRSKPLRFRCLGTPQRRRLGWACGLWPSQVQAAPANRCLASALSPDWGGWRSYHLPRPSCLASWARSGSAAQVCHVSPLGADLWLRPSWQMSSI